VLAVTAENAIPIFFVSWLAWCTVKAPLSIVDVLAFLPFYVELLFNDPVAGRNTAFVAVLRLVRLFRIFRLLKFTRKYFGFKFLNRAVKRSAQALGLLLFLWTIGLVLFSTLMYYVERGTWNEALQRYDRAPNEPSPFSSIPASMWFVLETLTTCGYGDIYPVTSLGKFITAWCMLCGLLTVAIPLSIISVNYSQSIGRTETKPRPGEEEEGDEEDRYLPSDSSPSGQSLLVREPVARSNMYKRSTARLASESTAASSGSGANDEKLQQAELQAIYDDMQRKLNEWTLTLFRLRQSSGAHEL